MEFTGLNTQPWAASSQSKSNPRIPQSTSKLNLGLGFNKLQIGAGAFGTRASNNGDGDSERFRDSDGEEKAGVRKGGPTTAKHERPHPHGEGGELEAGQGDQQERRPTIVLVSPSPALSYRRVPRW